MYKSNIALIFGSIRDKDNFLSISVEDSDSDKEQPYNTLVYLIHATLSMHYCIV